MRQPEIVHRFTGHSGDQPGDRGAVPDRNRRRRRWPTANAMGCEHFLHIKENRNGSDETEIQWSRKNGGWL